MTSFYYTTQRISINPHLHLQAGQDVAAVAEDRRLSRRSVAAAAADRRLSRKSIRRPVIPLESLYPQNQSGVHPVHAERLVLGLHRVKKKDAPFVEL